MSIKFGEPDHPVLDILSRRWSPYLFDPRPVETDKLLACLEAARWAASSFNEQPWSLLIAQREDEAAFNQMIDCLTVPNQAWARRAGVLIITVVKHRFTLNDNPNRVAEHDVGLAMGNLCAQATALGLAVHQMAGIQLDKIAQTYHIPEGYAPLTAIAMGYAGSPDQAQEEVLAQLAERDNKPRTRKPLREWVFKGTWGRQADVFG